MAFSVWTRHVSASSEPPPCARHLRLDREILRLAGRIDGRQSTVIPDHITVSNFQPGLDDDELLALNRRAFEDHPEQGSMNQDDLDLRSGQPWFDPSGFLILREAGAMVGFCWTKIHRQPGGDVGEIYVIGVDPAHGGHGLGRVAVTAGLDALAQAGLHNVMLYVEATNSPAIGLYASLGLAEQWRDRRWTTAP